MQPYRCADFDKLWHAIEVSKSLKKGGAKELRAEADAAERKQAGGSAGTAPTTVKEASTATATANKPSGPAKAASVPSKAASREAASVPSKAASREAASGPSKAASREAAPAPSKAVSLEAAPAPSTARSKAKAATPAEGRASKRERDAPEFKVHDMVWYKGKATDPYWPAQILHVDTAARTYNVDPFGDRDQYVPGIRACARAVRPAGFRVAHAPRSVLPCTRILGQLGRQV